MQKRLRYMRRPEPVHNFLSYKQYGFMALGGGRLKWSHFEMVRLVMVEKWIHNECLLYGELMPCGNLLQREVRDNDWVAEKEHYVTPIKAGRIILELGGKCEFAEVKDFLHKVAMKLPFKAMVVSQERLEEIKRKEEADERNNMNPYNMKYIIQNNMGVAIIGCHPLILNGFVNILK